VLITFWEWRNQRHLLKPPKELRDNRHRSLKLPKQKEMHLRLGLWDFLCSSVFSDHRDFFEKRFIHVRILAKREMRMFVVWVNAFVFTPFPVKDG
jgi:hypothetical protein